MQRDRLWAMAVQAKTVKDQKNKEEELAWARAEASKVFAIVERHAKKGNLHGGISFSVSAPSFAAKSLLYDLFRDEYGILLSSQGLYEDSSHLGGCYFDLLKRWEGSWWVESEVHVPSADEPPPLYEEKAPPPVTMTAPKKRRGKK